MRRQFEQIIELLKSEGVSFEGGLTDEEIQKIQVLFNIKFPPDLRLFLQLALPVSYEFINWRNSLFKDATKEGIDQILGWPLRGILFDVKNNEFWLDEWGQMPTSFSQKEAVVRQNYINYPTLVPIYSHRYIPSEPNEFDNPVFSVYQTDVIYYGFNLSDYFAKEFHLQLPDDLNLPMAPVREVKFWGNFVE